METLLVICCVFMASALLGWYCAHQDAANYRTAYEMSAKQNIENSANYERALLENQSLKQALRDRLAGHLGIGQRPQPNESETQDAN